MKTTTKTTTNFVAPAERPASSVVYRISEFTKAKSRFQNFKISEFKQKPKQLLILRNVHIQLLLISTYHTNKHIPYKQTNTTTTNFAERKN